MSRRTLRNVALPDHEDTIVLHPLFSRWPTLLKENVRRSPETIGAARAELLGSAWDYTRTILGAESSPDASRHVVATGHQCLWHHGGIWAKNVAACRLAEAVGGTALHLVLDHDVRSSTLVLPESASHDGPGVTKVEIEQGSNPVPIEFRAAPERGRIEAFVAAICRAVDDSVCSEVWRPWIRRAGARPLAFAGMTDFITFMQAAVSLSLGLKLLYLPVSRLSESAAFLAFAARLIRGAREFALGYNEAIEQLEPAGIRRLNVRDAGRTELPLWLVSPEGCRESLWVGSGAQDRICLGTERQQMDSLDASREQAAYAQLKAVLARRGCRLRPKAVTLTLFARMVMADWFVHGVGAQGYEAVTDRLMERGFGRQAPHYGIATCTMRLPIAQVHGSGASPGASALKHRLHHLKHNPERYLHPEQLREDWIHRLVEEKSSLLVRLGRDAPDDERKKAIGARLREINERLLPCLGDLTGSFPPTVRPGSARIALEAFDSREFFFGLFPTERLRTVAASVAGTVYA